MSIKRLRQFIEEDLIYQAYKKKNDEPNKAFERQCFVHCRDIENVLDVLDEIREYINARCLEKDGLVGYGDDLSPIELIEILDKVKE